MTPKKLARTGGRENALTSCSNHSRTTAHFRHPEPAVLILPEFVVQCYNSDLFKREEEKPLASLAAAHLPQELQDPVPPRLRFLHLFEVLQFLSGVNTEDVLHEVVPGEPATNNSFLLQVVDFFLFSKFPFVQKRVSSP